MKLALWMPVLALFFVLTFPSPTAYAEVGQNDQDKFRLSDCSGLQNLQVPASLIELPTSGAIVQTAAPVGAADKDNANGDFCKVIGIIKPVNPKSPNIEFEVNLPISWNGRALQMGGGGYNGTLVNGLTGYSLQPANEETPLKKGYVTMGSDGGHKSSWPFDGRFGLDDEALQNFGRQSIKKVHDTAIAVGWAG